MFEAPCTQDQFSGYFLMTAYDVLGDGGFSKHLKAKSTRGEEWALLLSEQYSAIAAVLDKLTESVKDLQEWQLPRVLVSWTSTPR